MCNKVVIVVVVVVVVLCKFRKCYTIDIPLLSCFFTKNVFAYSILIILVLAFIESVKHKAGRMGIHHDENNKIMMMTRMMIFL